MLLLKKIVQIKSKNTIYWQKAMLNLNVVIIFFKCKLQGWRRMEEANTSNIAQVISCSGLNNYYLGADWPSIQPQDIFTDNFSVRRNAVIWRVDELKGW